MENEIRYDEFTGRIVIVARRRGKRPHKYLEEVVKEERECPFCPGHEDETPKATLLYIMEGDKSILRTSDQGDKRRNDWSVRVFPNMYPALTTEAKAEKGTLSTYGYHEVVVENPHHYWRYEDAEPRAIELPLLALMERGRFMESDDKIEYVAIFKNQGKDAGASIVHPHYQIIGSTFVPSLISQEMNSYSKCLERAGQCPLCNLSSTSRDDGRLVFTNEHFVVITPFASIFPYECWVVPKHHTSSFLESSVDEVGCLAITLKKLFLLYKNAIGSFPFNMTFHSRNVGKADFHWHLEVYPRIAVHAGLELGSGVYINIIGPEEAALQLLQAQSDSNRSSM